MPVGARALKCHLFGADEVGLEDQFIRDTRHSGLALLVEPEVLHLKGHIGIAAALKHFVVKIMLPRSHGPEREGKTWLTRGDQALNIVRERYNSGCDLKIKVSKGATCLCRPGSDGSEKQGGMLRHEGGAEPTVGQRAGEFQAFGAEGCQVNRQVRSRRDT